LLLIDVINDLAFTGSEALIAQAEPMALRLAALKRRTSAAGIVQPSTSTTTSGKLFAPADCIVSNTATDNDHALRQIATVLKGNITESQRLTFRRSRRATVASGRPKQESKR
jgi:hypothetical protein